MNVTPEVRPGDWEMLHWAVGILIGIRSRAAGDIDITIYHDTVRIRIEEVKDAAQAKAEP